MTVEQAGIQQELKELRAEIAALKMQEALLRSDYDRLQQLYDKAPLGYQSLDENGCFVTVNQAWLDILGYRREEVVGRSFADFLHPDWQNHFRENFPRFKALGEILGVEFEMRCKEGRTVTVAFDGKIGRDSDGNFQQTHCIFRDVTARRAEEAKREAERQLLHICHNAEGTRELVGGLVAFFQNLTHCEAVGIRLRLRDDYPYYESSGFPPHFLHTENFLCERAPDGAIVRDSSGLPVLECMCGNVLRGRFDLALPFFTERGSFWTNSTSDLLAATTEADRQARTRNRCNGEGYESVALIPFRLRGETYGLLQLNDHARDRFTPQLIAEIEDLAAYVSLSFSKHLADTFRQETEEKYRLLVETAQEGIIITARQRLLLLNPAAARIAGYPAAEMYSKTFADLIHPDDLALVMERHRRRLRGEEIPSFTSFRIKSGDGRIKWVEVNGSQIRWQGEPAVLNFITDITARKQAEDALHASRRLLNASQRLTRAGGWEWNALSETMSWTEETFRIHDLDPEEPRPAARELIELSLACYRQEDRPTIETAFRRCVERGIPYDLQFPFTTVKGRSLWIRTTAMAIRSGRRITSVVGTIVDITEQHQASENLRRNEAAMRAILDASRESIHLVDADGTVLMANAVTARRLGLTVPELIGRNIFSLFPPDLADSRLTLIKRVAAGGQPLAVGDERNGRYYETVLCPVQDDGATPKLAIFATDVTERKAAEQAMLASEARYRALFEHLPVAVWEEDFTDVKQRLDRLTAEGVADLRGFLREHPQELLALAGMVRVVGINQHSVRILGAADKDEVFRNLNRYFTAESLEVFADELAALASGKSRFQAEIPIVDVRGRPVMLDLTLSIDPSDLTNWSRVLATFIDITERKRSERQLREQAMILDQISDAVTVTDLDGVITYVNRASARKVGRSVEELVGRHVDILGDDTDYGVDQRQLIETTLAHGSWQGEVVNFTAAGQRVLMDCRINMLFDENGRKIGMCGISTDITGKRRTENLLRARLRLSEEAATQTVEKVMQLALDEAERLTGSRTGFFHFYAADRQSISLQAWSTATVRDFCRVQDERQHYGLDQAGVWADAIRLQKAIIHDDVGSLPGLGRLPAGHPAVLRELVVPVIRGGLVTAVLGVGNKPSSYDNNDIELVSRLADMVWDIVLRKQVEKALRDSEERFRGIFAVSPAGIALVDPADLRIIVANRSFLDIVGYTEEELRGKQIIDLTHPDDWADEHRRLVDLLAGTGSTYSETKRYIRKDGSVRWVRLMADNLQQGDGGKLLIGNAIDITDRVLAEESIRLEEARLESLLRIAQYPTTNIQELLDFALNEAIRLTGSRIGYIYFYDEDQQKFTLNSWSREVMHQCGVVEPQTVYHLRHTGLWGEAVRQRQPIIDNDYGSGGPLKKGLPQGHVALSRFLTVPVFSEDRIVAVAAVANKGRDYDERDVRQLILMMDAVWKVVHQRRAEAEREEGIRRLRLATDSVKLGVWDWDVTANRILWNDRMYEIYGTEPGGDPTVAIWTERLHPDDKARAQAEVLASLEGRGVFDTVFRIVLPDGEVKHIKADGLVTRDPQGQPLRMLGVNRDITAQYRAEQEYRQLFESMLDGFALHEIIVDAMGTPIDYRFLAVNSAFERMTGIRANEAVGRTVLELMPDTENYWFEIYGRVALGGEPVTFENYSSVLGKYFQISAFQPVCRQFACIFRDITDRVRAEQEQQKLEAQLRQAQKLEAIGTLAGGIAHDFNNILGAILGYAEIAQEDCQPNSLVAEDVEQIIVAGNRARDLVKQILAFSRQTEIEQIPLQLSIIVKEAIKLLRSSLPTTIRIVEDIDGEAGLVLADPTQIHQVLMNLCTNAYHAMEKQGGTLTISLQQRSLAEADLQGNPESLPGEYVQLAVRDTGPGIPPEIRERIFDPYFTTKEQGKGTGLGLSIVRGIMISCGGFVTCRSTPGEGSEFCVSLPVLSREEKPLAAQESDAAVKTGNENILFVDDEEALVTMGRKMLQRMGYRVIGLTDSRAALELFRQQPEQFDLVITDQTMPEMTGIELASAILRVRPDMPVILCTGYSNLISEEKAEAIGVKGFALKPLAKKDVATMIRKVLGGTSEELAK